MPTTVAGMLNMVWTHPANRGRRVRALAGMAAWQAWKRMVRRPVDLRIYDDLTFRAYPDSTAPVRFIYFGGLPDYEEMTFMRHYLRPGDGFLDGGANEGMFTLLAAKLVGSTGEVHAFDAVPVYLDRLRDNLRSNRMDWVTVHPQALGAEAGPTSFVLRGTGSRIQTSPGQGKTVAASIVRLDDVIPERRWAMGKLDIEGAELLALKGASALFERHEPAVWMLELVDRQLERFGASIHTVRQWLDDRGYDLVLYEPEHRRFVTAPDPLYPLADALALSRLRRPEVEARISADPSSTGIDLRARAERP